jgi:hypothetical protein
VFLLGKGAYCKIKVKSKNTKKTARKQMARALNVFYDGVYAHSSQAR